MKGNKRQVYCTSGRRIADWRCRLSRCDLRSSVACELILDAEELVVFDPVVGRLPLTCKSWSALPIERNGGEERARRRVRRQLDPDPFVLLYIIIIAIDDQIALIIERADIE